uniref:FZ domain-containing protein n=1 Tax=Clastoptera arizonana TaxID=38151 RepID=A0A1B6DCZ3_9HEMI
MSHFVVLLSLFGVTSGSWDARIGATQTPYITDWSMGGGRHIHNTCVDIPRNMTLCHEIGYKKMRLPNLLDHDTIAEISQQAASWVPLMNVKCHPDTQLFLCSLFSPVCLDRPEISVYPCRSLCYKVKAGCEGKMKTYGYPWPEMFNCERFPQDNDMCITSQATTDSVKAVDTQSLLLGARNLNNANGWYGISGGKITSIRNHPYQVSILYKGAYLCSGVILRKNWVLTLADAVYRGDPELYKIRVGSDSSIIGGQLYDVGAVYSHDNFSVVTHEFDLGLLKLKSKIKFNKKVRKVNYATKNIKSGQRVILSGWNTSPITKVTYHQVSLRVVPLKKCQKAYSHTQLSVTASMLCASSRHAGHSHGDFGDPIVIKKKVYGLFSWTVNWTDDNFPSLFTNIAAGADWIKSKIGK